MANLNTVLINRSLRDFVSQNFCKIPWPFVKGLSFMRFQIAFFFLKLSQRNFDVVSCLSSLSHFHFIAIYSFIKTLTKQRDRGKKNRKLALRHHDFDR